MIHAWRSESAILLGGLVTALCIGWLEGRITLFAVIFLLVYLARHLYYAVHLLTWLRNQSNELPDGNGIWSEIFHHHRLLKRRHRRRKRRLAKILKRFQQATSALPDATVVLTREFTIEWFNKAAARLLGLDKKDTGLRIDNLIRLPKFVEYLEKSQFDRPLSLRAPKNERIQLEIRIVSYASDRYLLVARDVTQIHLLERQRRDFVAHVSHELRTPLTVLKGYLETLTDSTDVVAPSYRPMLMRMDEQILRLQYLVDDLLYLSRLETTQEHPGRHRPVDISVLVQEICKEAVHVQERHAPFDLKIDSNAKLLGNEQELRSAITNLIINAIKYTPETGKISIRWHADQSGGYLEVRDTGRGIPAEHLYRVTERFYRVPGSDSANPTGTGLGLAIVKHVLNRHGGCLEIQSKVGRGSTFRCHFPPERIVS